MLTLFILFTSQVLGIYSDLAEESKYINTLEEPARKEFVDKVLRRIAEEIDVKDYVPSEDTKTISDAQLDKHSNYVKQIIKEEKENFEKKGVKVNDVSNKDILKASRRLLNLSSIDYTRTKGNETKEAKVNTKVELDTKKEELDPVKEAENDDIQVKDLKPKTRRLAQEEAPDSTTPNTVVTTNEGEKNDKSENNSDNLAQRSDHFTESKNEVTDAVTETQAVVEVTTSSTVQPDTKNLKVDRIDTQAQKLEEKSVRNKADTEVDTPIDNGELSDQNKVLKESKHENSNEKKDSTLIRVKVESNGKISKRNDEKKLVVRSNTKNDSANVAENPVLNMETTEAVFTTTIAVTQNIKRSNNDTENKEELTETSTFVVPKLVKKYKTLNNTNVKQKAKARSPNLTTTVNLENNTSVLTNNKTRKVISVNKKDSVRNKVSVREIKGTVKSKKEILAENKENERFLKEVTDELNTLQIVEDVVKALKMGIKRDANNKKAKARNSYKKNNRKKVHIYGLRDGATKKSARTREQNVEQPYYAPVYNFYPENAYYNSYNKFGPNYEDLAEKKDEDQHTPLKPDDYSDASTKDVYRSFLVKKHHKKTKIKNPSNYYNLPYSYNILPSIVNKPFKPYNPPMQEYDEFDNDHYVRKKKIQRTKVDDTEETLKQRLKSIRESTTLLKDKEANNKIDDNGWLDENVKYLTDKKKKNDANNKASKNIYYEHDSKDADKANINLLLKEILKFTNPVKNSKEVVTRVKKAKSDVPEIQKVFPLLKNIVKIAEAEEDKEVAACVKVMGDLIHRNDEGLEHYDWLESTVNVQSAIGKLLDLTRAAIEHLPLHPSDLELLKYATYLHSLAKEDLRYSELSPSLRRTKSRLPRNRRGPRLVKEKGLIANRIWLYRINDPDKDYVYDYQGLRTFLGDLSDNLYDLHEALKHVSSVTSFRSQHWYKNLKDLYIHNPDKKKLLEVILHLATTRLFNLIEESSKSGIEENFEGYIRKNQVEVSGVRDAFVFVLKVLQAAMYESFN